MESFGKQLRKCRESARPNLSQEELGAVFEKPKKQSQISRLENDKPDVAIPSETDFAAIEKLLSKNDVPQNDLNLLRNLWLAKQGVGGSEARLTELILQELQELLEEYRNRDFTDYEALRQEISSLKYRWSSLASADREFSDGRLTFEQAEKKIKQLIDDAETRGMQRWIARAKLQLGIYRGYRGKNELAESDFTSGLEALSSFGEDDKRLKFLLNLELGDLYRTQDAGHWRLALEKYEKAMQYRKSEAEESIIARKKASVFLYAGNPAVALSLCTKSLDIARSHGDHKMERKALEHLAWANSMLGKIEEAIIFQNQAHALASKLGAHSKELAKSHRYLGDFHLLANNYEEAIANYRRALVEIANTREQMKDTKNEQENVLRGWVILGLSNAFLQEPELHAEGKKHCSDCLSLSDEMGYIITKGLCYLTLGDYAAFEEQYPVAEEFYRKARVVFEESGLTDSMDVAENPYYMAELGLRLSRYHLRRGNASEALLEAETAFDRSDKHGFIPHKANALLAIAISQAQLGNIDSQDLARRICAGIEVSFIGGKSLTNQIVRTLTKDIVSLRKRNPKLTVKLIKSLRGFISESDQLAVWREDKDSALPEFLRTLEEEMILLRATAKK